VVRAGPFITLALRHALSQRMRWQADPARYKRARGKQDSGHKKLFFDSLNNTMQPNATSVAFMRATWPYRR
jgi:hypothetical protein